MRQRTSCAELVALDCRLAAEPILQQFAQASRRVGHINCRSCARSGPAGWSNDTSPAAENSQAHGWHTLVFGVTLAIYSLPLRQGAG